MRERFLLSRGGRLLVDSRLGEAIRCRRGRAAAARWREGQVPPPHAVKQALLRELAHRYGARTLIETGTYLGDMVFALRDDFAAIHSIELGERYYRAACRRFRRFGHVKIHLGDSGAVLGPVLASVSARALLWLDGHYSGGNTARGAQDCPIWQELAAVIAHNSPRHVVVIDDMHCFIGERGYPTVDEVRRYADRKFGSYESWTERNAIVLAPVGR